MELAPPSLPPAPEPTPAAADEQQEEWLPAALQPPRKDPNAPPVAPSSRPFSAGFQRLLEQELAGQPAWAPESPRVNAGDTRTPALTTGCDVLTYSSAGDVGGGWVNPGDESAIDAELAAAEARVPCLCPAPNPNGCITSALLQFSVVRARDCCLVKRGLPHCVTRVSRLLCFYEGLVS